MARKKMVPSKECPGKYQFEYYRKDGTVSYSSPFEINSGRKKEGENLSKDFLKSDEFKNALSLTNYGGKATDSHLKKIGIDSKEMSKVGWDKYMKSDVTPDGTRVWSITDKGRNYLSKLEGTNVGTYRSQTKDAYYKHDIKLAGEIAYHMEKGHIQKLYSEGEIKDMWEKEMYRLSYEDPMKFQEALDKNMSPPDVVYINQEGQMVAIEVISPHYTQSQIDAKMEFCSFMNIEYTSVNCG